jgi:hypothetical protein
MKTYPELREIGIKATRKLTALHNDIEVLILTFQKGEAMTPVAISGMVEGTRDVPRLLREVADKLEADRGKLVVS